MQLKKLAAFFLRFLKSVFWSVDFPSCFKQLQKT